MSYTYCLASLHHLLDLQQKYGFLRLCVRIDKEGATTRKTKKPKRGAMMLVGLDSRSNNAARNRNALRGGAALTAGMLFAAGAALPAVAADPPEDRVLIPPEQVSVQLY